MPQNIVHHINFHWELAYSHWETSCASQNYQENIVIYFWLNSVIKKSTTKKLYLIEGKAALIIYLISPQNEAPYENDNIKFWKKKKLEVMDIKKTQREWGCIS